MQELPSSLRPARNRLSMLLVTCALCFGTAAIGAALTAGPVREWYPTIRKPYWTPPDWIFGPVWTLLFLLMAVSAWLVWCRAPIREARWGPGLFLGQLVLNAGWSGLFFALRSPGIALAEILILWAAIVATIVSFRRASTVAAVLLAPYLLWVSYAAALNAAIWWMNS